MNSFIATYRINSPPINRMLGLLKYKNDKRLVKRFKKTIGEVNFAAKEIVSDNKGNSIIGDVRILNSKVLKKTIGIKNKTSISDLEIILKLWNKYQNKGLKLIEGYFAFVIFNGKNIIVSRDIYGVKPVFIGGLKDEVVISSELRPVIEINPTWADWFSPGTIMEFSQEGKTEKKYYSALIKKIEYGKNKEFNYISEAIKLQSKKLKDLGIKKVGIPLSGGVDSSTIAVLSKKYFERNGVKVIAVTSGIPGSKDMEYAKKVATLFKIPLKIRIIKKSEILELIKNTVRNLEYYNSNLVKNGIGKYVTAKLARSLNISVLICADSIDEQLWGYHMIPPYSKECKKYFEQFSSPEETWKDIFNSCYKTEGQELDGMNRAFGLESWLPYLYKKLVDYNLNLPSRYKIKKINGQVVVKWALRDAVKNLLPKEIAFRQKMPQRLGSGLQGIINEVIEQEVSDKEFNELRIKLKKKGYSIHDKLEIVTFKIWSEEFDPELKYGKILNKFNLYPMVGY